LTRPDLAPDCPEEFDPGFYKWIWDFPNHSQKKMDDALATIGAHASQIIITSDAEARTFLESIHPKTD